MPKREIKKTVISYGQEDKNRKQSPERSREKQQPKVQIVDRNLRKAKLLALRKQQQNQQLKPIEQKQQITVTVQKIIQKQKPQQKIDEQQPQISNNIQPEVQNKEEPQDQSQQHQQEQENKILLKPIYLRKQDRDDEEQQIDKTKQIQRKKKALKYTTKMLLLQNAKADAFDDDEIMNSSDEDNRTNMPDDDDQKNEEFEYEQWKIRELKRIRRQREERRKAELQRVEIERRRRMNNQQILLENKVMGSDANAQSSETKYVYLQKYYHKGAFYQDSQDPIFKRDYNLPTPLEMQDKSMLPELLQKRKGNFGSKGQSKYKHLTAEDTTNFDPQFKADESILANWKKKTAGYKGYGGSNI